MEERRPGAQWPWLVGMDLSGVVGFTVLLYSGLKFTTATNAGLINGAGPLIISLMAALFLRERLTVAMLAGAVLSLSGVAFIASGGSLENLLALQFNLGDVLVLGAVIAWGVYSLLSRVVTRTRSALAATALSSLLGLPFLVPLALLEQTTQPVNATPLVLAACVYIGLFPSVVAYLAWNEGIRRVGAARGTIFYNMLTVFAALLGTLVLGEPFTQTQIIGGALVMGGSFISLGPELWKSFRSQVTIRG
jgi:drug/metabolite transporter (DMT)-like permease